MTKYFFLNGHIYTDNSVYISTQKQPNPSFQLSVLIIPTQLNHNQPSKDKEISNVKTSKKEE